MERLTYKDEAGYHLKPKYEDVDTVSVVGRYEDTGLEPEEIKGLQLEVAALKTIEAMYDGLGRTYHLRELVEAERDGRLVVLPIKVGTHVFMDGREAIAIEFFGYKSERYFKSQFFDNQQYISFAFEEIGKSVFLTRKEAEAALEKEKGGDEG